MEQKKTREVVIDTYALMAVVYDEVGESAKKVLEGVRRGEVKGLVPVTVAYEYIVHWLKGRIPGLKSISEVVTYLKSYFKIVELSLDDYVEAAKIKTEGDIILKQASDEDLRARKLSIVDSTVIALARRKQAPVLSGDKDLVYIAAKNNIEVIW